MGTTSQTSLTFTKATRLNMLFFIFALPNSPVVAPTVGAHLISSAM